MVNGCNPCKKCGMTYHSLGICDDLRFKGLLLLRNNMKSLSKEETSKLLVDLLHSCDSLYHFDDKPFDIIDGKSGETLFEIHECVVLMDIVMYCYCGELFSYACEKIGI